MNRNEAFPDYPIGALVIYQGREWRIIDRYFELRKLALTQPSPSESDYFPNVTVDNLNKEPYQRA